MSDQMGGHRENRYMREIDLVELAVHFLKKWKIIVCTTLLGAVISAVYTFCIVTPLYEASSTLYVLNRNDSVINFSDLQLGSALAKDYVKVFDMWEVHEEVISNLELPYSYKEIREMLKIVNDADTRMLEIHVTSPDAQEAANIANEYAKVSRDYIADTMATEKPNIMSVALVPVKPVSPNGALNLVLGSGLGMFLACAYIAVLFVLDDKYKTVEDIRKYTGLTTLAVIPMEGTQTEKNASGRKQ